MTSSTNIIAGSGTSFSIHGAGWFLIFLICFSIFIGYKIAKRQQKDAKEKNFFAVGYISLIIFCCSLFGTFFLMASSNNLHYLSPARVMKQQLPMFMNEQKLPEKMVVLEHKPCILLKLPSPLIQEKT